MVFLDPYKVTILIFGITGFFFLAQLVIADVVGLKTKHIPGYPIEPTHKSFLFRASRAISNSNESVAIFILFTLFAILSSASPRVVNIGAVIYGVSRVAHMVFYYFDLKMLRSGSFVTSLCGLFSIFVGGFMAWIA